MAFLTPGNEPLEASRLNLCLTKPNFKKNEFELCVKRQESLNFIFEDFLCKPERDFLSASNRASFKNKQTACLLSTQL